LAFRPAPGHNVFTLRREAVVAPMTRLIDGKPGLLVNRRCVKLRAGLAGKYCFRRISHNGDTFRDAPDKNIYSHVSEALQYLCLGLGEGREILRAPTSRDIKPQVVTGTRYSHRVAQTRRQRARA